MLFTDTVTVMHKGKRTVVNDCQWKESTKLLNDNGRMTAVKTITLTVQATAPAVDLIRQLVEDDCIFYGDIDITITEEKGSRMSDYLRQYPSSGRVHEVRDNTNRDMLPSVKVVLY